MQRKFWPLLVALMILLTGLGWLRVSIFKEKEQNVIAELQAGQSPSSIQFFQTISDYGKYINLGIPALFLVMGLVMRKNDFARKGLLILLAMGLSGIISQSIKRTLKEPRPYEVDSRITQWSVGGSNSFPSGHTAEVTAATLGFTIILFRTPLSILLSVVWALLMMFSRIVLGVHNFTDILGGIVVGCLGILVMQKIFDRLWKADQNALQKKTPKSSN